MKNIIIYIFIGLSLLACSSSDDNNNNVNNPFLTIPPVNLDLNLNLPEYNTLKFPGNNVIITNQGIKGIVIYNVNNNLYTAFELSDPNHTPNSCSRMTVGGILATCQCGDENKYDIVTGQHQSNQSNYPMQQYRTEREGDFVRVFN